MLTGDVEMVHCVFKVVVVTGRLGLGGNAQPKIDAMLIAVGARLHARFHDALADRRAVAVASDVADEVDHDAVDITTNGGTEDVTTNGRNFEWVEAKTGWVSCCRLWLRSDDRCQFFLDRVGDVGMEDVRMNLGALGLDRKEGGAQVSG